MKLLRRVVRNLILEFIHPKIDSMIERLVARKDPSRGRFPKVIIYTGRVETRVVVYNGVSTSARIDAKVPDPVTKKWKGFCNNSWRVYQAQAKRELGPLAYEVLMEYATLNGGALVSDRTQLSPEAFNVWQKYLERSLAEGDVEALQLDWYDVPQAGRLTPEYEDDDCEHGTSETYYYKANPGVKSVAYYDKDEKDWRVDPNYKDYWLNNDPLAKAYRKSPNSTMKKLEALGMLEIRKG